jgi:dTMP kinase
VSGLFITIEGAEGVGKSTNIAFIRTLLTSLGIAHIATREPGGTPLAERVRTLLLDKDEEVMDSMTELLLMFAARRQHVEELIRPALRKGQWVVCDRFTDSTYAYQGGGRGLDRQEIETLEQLCLGDFRPDLILVLDLDTASGMSRAMARAELDRFEREDEAFFDRVRQVFLERARQGAPYHLIDAGQPLVDVQAQIRQVIVQLAKHRDTVRNG